MDDASLDDFLDGGDADAADDEGEDGEAADGEAATSKAADGDGRDGEPDGETADPAPAAATYQWDPAGVACAACGEAVTERWQGEAGLVCAACKAW
jgi:hypothetical protein